jgi:hypothetical protein
MERNGREKRPLPLHKIHRKTKRGSKETTILNNTPDGDSLRCRGKGKRVNKRKKKRSDRKRSGMQVYGFHRSYMDADMG